ncbi:MAG: response regulator [Bacilli bacterium]|nr:response regulator [Bacilli bacterium]
MKDVNLLISNGVDVNKSLELFGDMELYNTTLKDFLDGVDEKMAKIQAFKEVGDMANYAILVHSLKSDARYLGFTVLGEIAFQHEMDSKANNIYAVSDNYNKLVQEASRIINLVKNYLGEKVENITTIEHVQQSLPKEHALLVIDDSDIIRNFIEKIFNNSFEVIMAGDGLKAIEIIEKSPSGRIIGALLDLNMPNVDGFAVLEYFKMHEMFSKIPVSIITGESSKEVIDRAFKYNIVDMLTKPFNERDVKRIVEKTINSNLI